MAEVIAIVIGVGLALIAGGATMIAAARACEALEISERLGRYCPEEGPADG